MVNDRIMKRRKRAQIGTLLAVMLILLPLPVGSLIVGNMNDFGVQQSVFVLNDDLSDDLLFGSDVSYDNVTDVYTLSKIRTDDSVINRTSDVETVKFLYQNGTTGTASTAVSFTGQSKSVYLFPTIASGDTIGTNPALYPKLVYYIPVSAEYLLDNDVTGFNFIFDANQEIQNMSLSISVQNDAGDTSSGYLYPSTNFELDVNGTSFFVDIDVLSLLAASSVSPNGHLIVNVVDVDGNVFDTSKGVVMGLEFVGPEKSYSLTSTWNIALIATGLIGMFGALLATPFVSLESFSNDGMQGKKYKKGYVGKKQNYSQKRRY